MPLSQLSAIIAGVSNLLPQVEEIYKDLHAHPELSMQEVRTAAIVAAQLRSAGFKVITGLGKTGVVGLLDNGAGKTVMLRADMDALPMLEASGVPYASTVTAVDSEGNSVAVAHACGHDVHVACLLGASLLFANHRDNWKGRLMVLFQPGEEVARGAQAMIDDGLFTKFPRPDVILGQHVNPAPAGTLAWRDGVVMSAADSMQIRLFGRGAHGSMPQASVDPVVMAAAVVMRLQTIVSRQVAPTDAVVVTIGSLHAGTKENVIPEEAVMKLNVRSLRDDVRKQVLNDIKRIVNAEAFMSGAPRLPEFTVLDTYPLLRNDPGATEIAVAAFRQHFPAESIISLEEPVMASEDFGCYGSEWPAPSFFWFIGGTDPSVYAEAERTGTLAAIPGNHNPKFAPAVQPTLETGIKALLVAACAWLSVE